LSPQFTSPWLERLLGNWEVSGIISKRSGLWFNANSGLDNSLSGVGADRPDLIGNSQVASPGLSQWFKTAAFRANPTGQFGNSGRNNIQGPGSFTFDAALMRRFRITERHSVEVRAEAFNILNHPVFNNPTATITSSNFGKILGANDPRIMQFALKYRF